jgi:hypothetical protein
MYKVRQIDFTVSYILLFAMILSFGLVLVYEKLNHLCIYILETCSTRFFKFPTTSLRLAILGRDSS